MIIAPLRRWVLPMRVRLLNSSAIVPRVLGRYIKDATHANMLRAVRVALPGMASSFRCYAAFCETQEVYAFPIHRGGGASAE